jgi:predicted ATPase
LRDALREAVAAHVLEASDGTYAFRHALLREVVEDDLLPGERTQLHLALARAMERRAADGGAGAHLAAGIAHHYQEAGDRPAALAAAVRAAEAAERVHAHGEAANLLERALELWELVPEPERVAGRDRIELLVRAGRSRALRNEPARAETLLRGALELLDPAADPERAATVMERLAHAQWHHGRQEVSLETTARALELLATAARPRQAALMSWQARPTCSWAATAGGRVGRGRARGGAAAGDRVGGGRALNAYGVAR